MSEELKQTGRNEALEKPVEIEAGLGKTAHVLDLRTGKQLGLLAKLRFTLDPWHPSLFAISEGKLELDELLRALPTAEQK
jgi:hypothetical protein